MIMSFSEAVFSKEAANQGFLGGYHVLKCLCYLFICM